LIEWLTSPEGRHEIAAFRPQGEQLFFLTEQTAHSPTQWPAK
jgi:ABC-type tungstate transport system permease subunit